MLNQKLLFLFLICFISFSAYSQDNNRHYDATYSWSKNDDGNALGPTTSIQPPMKKQSPEKEALLRELRQARLNNDLNRANELQKKLDNGSLSTSFGTNDPQKTGVIKTFEQSEALPVIFETDYNTSLFASGGFWAIQTMTSNKSNAIFAAVSKFVSGNSDSVIVYLSYNGGVSWVRKGASAPWTSTVDARRGEIDIEVIINGPDTIAFVSTAYNFDPGTGIKPFVLLQRFNIGTGTVSSDSWNFGGALSSAAVSTYNPKLTSDNTIYTSLSYVFVTVSHDSLIAEGSKNTLQRFGIFLTPFTSNTVTYRVANPSAGGFWWSASPVSVNDYLWQDICYYNASGTDRLYSVVNFQLDFLSANLYLAWSDNYGISNTGNFMFNQTNTVREASLASNAGLGQQTLCIGFRRQFSGNDWDFAGQFTTTGGTTTGSFTLSYPSLTTANSKIISLQAFKNQPGRYSFAWVDSVDNTYGNHFYRQTTNSGSTYTSSQLQTNNLNGDHTFGGTKAGYTPTGSDNCLVIWSQSAGGNTYCSYLICSTVGIGNENGIPLVYSLSQNYPNPFNPSTEIKFSIPMSEKVKLIVYDLLGREVATLVNTELQAGEYKLNFSADNLPSGIYLYKLTAGNFSDTKKMTLIK